MTTAGTNDLTGLDVSAEDAVGVWHDLERALAGKNGYGGDVAEIYAYRLARPLLRSPKDEAQARVAGVNMTRLLRHFLELHEGAVVSLEEREGFRPLDLAAEEFPPFDWRVHLRLSWAQPLAKALPIHDLRKALDLLIENTQVFSGALDELAVLRSKDRLRAEAQPPDTAVDLPPDAATGLYLDRPFDVEDLEWIKMAWDALGRSGCPAQRTSQLMLVFQAIRRDERSTVEFLRVMNTIVLPLCRRLRLKTHPHLAKIGTASE